MSDDLVRRSDVYKAVDDWINGEVSNLNIKDIPSVCDTCYVYNHGIPCRVESSICEKFVHLANMKGAEDNE